jgi:hypothetical protein
LIAFHNISIDSVNSDVKSIWIVGIGLVSCSQFWPCPKVPLCISVNNSLGNLAVKVSPAWQSIFSLTACPIVLQFAFMVVTSGLVKQGVNNWLGILNGWATVSSSTAPTFTDQNQLAIY